MDVINGQLLAACRTIEATRAKLWSERAVAEQERTLRLQCSDAYKRLHTKYGQMLQDLRDTSSNGVSLQRQLDDARGVISTYESDIEGYQRRLNDHANSVQMAEQEAARAKQLESTVRQLEEEKAVMAEKLESAQEYRAGFSIAANRLGAAEQKISELEKEKEGMVQAHQFAVATVADRLAAAEQKISELEKEKEGAVQAHQFAVATAAVRISAAERKVDELEQKCGSDDHIRSPTAVKRQRLDEVSHNDGPATRSRKRRAVVQSGGDTITVRV
jgi:chromosome segregation ATPase